MTLSPVLIEQQIEQAIRSVTGSGPVALHEPNFAGNEWTYVKDCLDSTFVSSVGKYVDRFEADLATYSGANHAVAVASGTAALHVALLLAGVRPGDEVLLPALTFVATANAVSYCHATPHFVDSEVSTLGIAAEKLRDYLNDQTDQQGGRCVNRTTGRVIRALLPMHTFGHPVDLDGLMAVADDFNLALIEDASESLGTCYRGRHTGTFGLMGALSFNGNKTITTGGGGAILTDDPELARRAKHLTTTAKTKHAWEFVHDEIGYNYRMPNINAALGCAQLEQLPAMLKAKRDLHQRYQAAFASVTNVRLIAEPAQCQSNYWLQAILLDENSAERRNSILQATNAAGLMTRPVWTLLHELAPYRACPRMDLAGAELLSRRLINIPSSAHLASPAQ
jgi:aminotransferase in exopolysaccharide biosynthesis